MGDSKKLIDLNCKKISSKKINHPSHFRFRFRLNEACKELSVFLWLFFNTFLRDQVDILDGRSRYTTQEIFKYPDSLLISRKVLNGQSRLQAVPRLRAQQQ